jgi:hypothetical protein
VRRFPVAVISILAPGIDFDALRIDPHAEQTVFDEL